MRNGDQADAQAAVDTVMGTERAVEGDQSQGLVHPLMPVRRSWVPVRCPGCSRLLLQARPGSEVNIRCRHCKEVFTLVAA